MNTTDKHRFTRVNLKLKAILIPIMITLLASCGATDKKSKRQLHREIVQSLLTVNPNTVAPPLPDDSAFSTKRKESVMHLLVMSEEFAAGNAEFRVIAVEHVSDTRECWTIQRKDNTTHTFKIKAAKEKSVAPLEANERCSNWL